MWPLPVGDEKLSAKPVEESLIDGREPRALPCWPWHVLIERLGETEMNVEIEDFSSKLADMNAALKIDPDQPRPPGLKVKPVFATM